MYQGKQVKVVKQANAREGTWGVKVNSPRKWHFVYDEEVTVPIMPRIIGKFWKSPKAYYCCPDLSVTPS